MRRGMILLLPAAGIVLSNLIPVPGHSGNSRNLFDFTSTASTLVNELPGDFMNEQGEWIGNDGKNDGKLYVIKTAKNNFESFGDVKAAGISDSLSHNIEKFIRLNSGDSAAFQNNTGLYTNVQEIEMSKEIRQKMLEIVKKDDGKGDTLSSNNREYGGTVDNEDRIKESSPGSVCDPSSGSGAGIDIPTSISTKIEFHSHPSGARTIAAGEHKQLTWCYHQAASATDIEKVGNLVGYVFGRRDNIVYIYNNKGILATIPGKYFVTPNMSGRTIANR